MQISAVQRILGLLLMVFSTTMLPPILVSLWYADGATDAFVHAFGLTLITGLAFWLPVARTRREMRIRDGFMVVVLFWSVLGVFGALPFVEDSTLQMDLADAVFESISGLTTTGATVIVGLDHLPESILYYRQQLQWFGGMGIIVLAVAVLPMLGVGGMQLYRAETPGPIKDSKLTPRITETAKALWYVYLTLTLACALGYWAAGMSLFDAIGHSFATLSLGGFSTHDASMGYFDDKPAVEVVAIVFMLLSGVNFALHFSAWRRRSVGSYFEDSEFKAYLFLYLAVGGLTSLLLYVYHIYPNAQGDLLEGFFQVVSIGTTAGFTSAAFDTWPTFVPVLLLFMGILGGCAGSTGGGIKVIRLVLLLKQGLREVDRLIHPNAVITIKLGGKPVPNRVVDSVWGFFATYVGVFTLFMLILMADGLDQVTAFSAVAACINNIGPGLGQVAANFSSLSDLDLWILSLAMLMGRLEIFTLLVILSPAFWRR